MHYKAATQLLVLFFSFEQLYDPMLLLSYTGPMVLWRVSSPTLPAIGDNVRGRSAAIDRHEC